MIKINNLYSIICLSVFLSACGGGSSGSDQSETPTEESTEIDIIHSGNNDVSESPTFKQYKIIDSTDHYLTELLNYNTETAEDIDFSNNKVLLINMGSRSTGGYSINVAPSELLEDDDTLTVMVNYDFPGNNCIVNQATTNPYVFYRIPTEKEILIHEEQTFTNCDADDSVVSKAVDEKDLIAEPRIELLHNGDSFDYDQIKQSKVITSTDQYYSELKSDLATIDIDFSANKVLSIDMGTRSSTGYSVTADQSQLITEDSSVAVAVTVIYSVPGDNCLTGDAITSPYAYYLIPTRNEVLIQEELVVENCIDN